MTRRVLWLDVALKALLIGLLLYAATHQDLHQFHGKGNGTRVVVYPFLTNVVPLIWLALGRRRGRYPFDVDILVCLPFLFDTLGNQFDMYSRYDWWDNINHFGNWAVLVAGAGLLLVRLRVRGWQLFGLAVGFGATTAILWELGEYVSFIHANASELSNAYHDTLEDLAEGLAGSVLAAALLARRFRART
jgi:hypothetical protein